MFAFGKRRAATALPPVIVALVVGASACGGGALGGDSGGSGSGDSVEIGLMVAKSGVYSSVGRDMERGFRLYLEQQGGKLGGRDVEIVDVDEGETPQTGVAAATRLVQQDQVDAVAGVVSGSTATATAELFSSNNVPLVVGNSGAVSLTEGEHASEYIWRASYVNPQPGEVLGKYLTEELDPDEKVYLIAPDYTGGKETISGFKENFPADRIAGETYTPFRDTSDFQPYLNKIRSSGASSVFSFYAGREAIDFAKQYDQFGLTDDTQLYSTGFLTEGSELDAVGQAAKDVKTVLHYNSDIDNPVNEKFVADYESAHGTEPTVYAAVMYDSAVMLDQALDQVSGEVTGEAVKDGLAKIEKVPGTRGEWSFNDNRDPIQPFYLREVEQGDNGLRNTIVERIGVAR